MIHILKNLVWLFLLSILLTAGCGKSVSDIENAQIPRLMIESRSPNYVNMSGKTVTLPISGTRIPVENTPIVNEFQIIGVEMVQVELGVALLFQVNDEASRELYRSSVSNNGSRVVLTINGNAVGARRLDGAIQDLSLIHI